MWGGWLWLQACVLAAGVGGTLVSSHNPRAPHPLHLPLNSLYIHCTCLCTHCTSINASHCTSLYIHCPNSTSLCTSLSIHYTLCTSFDTWVHLSAGT